MSGGRLFFGIDGGGTRSRIQIVDGSMHAVGYAVGESTNPFAVPPEELFMNLRKLFRNVLSQSGIGISDLAAGCMGSAGLSRPAERKLLADFFTDLVGEGIPVKLVSDGELLLCGGLQDLEGFCLVAGTGSLALSRSREGALIRAGGLGHMLGDEGSAWWIGRQAVGRTLGSLESRDLPTVMLEPLLAGCHLTDPSDFVAYFHRTAAKADIAALAPLVTAAADSGDPLALDILGRAADELFSLLRSVADRSPSIRNFRTVTTGGVLEHDRHVIAKFERLVAQSMPEMVIKQPTGAPVDGACLLASQIPLL